MKTCLLACAILGLGARALPAQMGPTQHGFEVHAIHAYDRVLIEVGDLRVALPRENVISFLRSSPLRSPRITFAEMMSDSPLIIARLPSPSGGLGGVLITGSLQFTRMDSLVVLVRISDGTGHRSLEIPVSEARLFGKMLGLAVKELESRAAAEAVAPPGAHVRSDHPGLSRT